MPPRYLVATDFSRQAGHALARADQLAQQHGAELSLLHSLGLDELAPLRALLGAQEAALESSLRAHALERLQGLALALRSPAQTQVEAGLPARVLAAQAHSLGAELLLLGARGETGLRRLLLGSTAGQLLRRFHGNALVVRKPAHQAYRRVLVAVDFSPAAERALQVVRRLAPQAHLWLLHGFELGFEGLLNFAGVEPAQIEALHRQARQRALAELEALAQRSGLPDAAYSLIVEPGDCVRAILHQAEQHQVDLIAMGKHGQHVAEELLLGSVTQRVLEQAHADLLVVSEPLPGERP